MTRSLALSGHVPGDHQRLAPPYCLLDGKHQSGGANAAACMFRPPFHNETWILLPRFPRHCCAVNAPCGMRDALATPGAALPLDTANQLPQPVFALPLLIGPVRAPGRRHAPFRVVFPPVLLTTPTYCWLGRRGLADNDDCKPWAEDRRREAEVDKLQATMSLLTASASRCHPLIQRVAACPLPLTMPVAELGTFQGAGPRRPHAAFYRLSLTPVHIGLSHPAGEYVGGGVSPILWTCMGQMWSLGWPGQSPPRLRPVAGPPPQQYPGVFPTVECLEQPQTPNARLHLLPF